MQGSCHPPFFLTPNICHSFYCGGYVTSPSNGKGPSTFTFNVVVAGSSTGKGPSTQAHNFKQALTQAPIAQTDSNLEENQAKIAQFETENFFAWERQWTKTIVGYIVDENSMAKVADFGISRILPENVSSIITKVMGTFGYLNPEYRRTQTLNMKSDVYSYGVVLYVLITGKPAIINEIKVSDWVHEMLVKKQNVADLRFEGKYHKRSLEEAIQIARECTSSESTSRPTMSIVVSKLGACLDIDDTSSSSDRFLYSALHFLQYTE
ncbi:putative leucine-rich repeat receptor-like serine/threonine-protein kinase [Acorus calamus]|uniref:non-specific serine/threonine protein kinase n=1 Tax=Acorus calamus TaxID=4465 RepID=A0AAV9CNH0_ACOCL|nr:putative leucine-rich repeat receptor-like serine/threonine-protein kinase [Acorus calamus]